MMLCSCSLVQIVMVGLLIMSSAQKLEKLKRGKRIFNINGCSYRGVVVHFRSSIILPDIEAVLGVQFKDSDYFSFHHIFPRVNGTVNCPSGIHTTEESTNFDFVCMQMGTENIGVVKDAKPRFYENLVYRLVHKREDCQNLNLYIPYQGKGNACD